MAVKQFLPAALVSAFLLGGVAGTYTGAVLSDRLGARRIILGSIILSIPTIWLISHAGTEIGAMLAVVASGFFIIGVVCYNYRFSADDAA